MDLKILLIASLVAGSAAALFVALATLLSRRIRDLAGKISNRRTATQTLTDALKIVPMLAAFRQRWATEENGRLVTHAGLSWIAEDFAALRWLSLWSGLILGSVFAVLRRFDLVGLFLASLSILAGLFTPGVLLRRRVDQRRREVEVSLPDFLDRMSLGLESGLGFDMALRRTAVDFGGLLGHEVRKLVRQLDRGHERAPALDELGQRVPSNDLQAFTAAVKRADQLGTSLAKTLRVQTALLRSRRKRRAHEASQRLPVLIVFPLVFFFLPSLLIIYLAPPLLHLFLSR
jgi:tight adherence protein C